MLISGKISRCTASDIRNFGSSTSGSCDVNITGIIEYCTSGIESFGANTASDLLVNISGEINNCKVIGQKGIVFSTPDNHKWAKYLDNTGEWQSEDLGI